MPKQTRIQRPRAGQSFRRAEEPIEDVRTKRQRTRGDKLREDLREAAEEIEQAIKETYG